MSKRELDGNQTKIDVTVNTNKLFANSKYQRDILLTTNSYPENQSLAVKVQTPKVIVSERFPYLKLISLLPLSAISFLIILLGSKNDPNNSIFSVMSLGALVGIIIMMFTNNRNHKYTQKLFLGGMRGIVLSVGILYGVFVIQDWWDDNHLQTLIGGSVGTTVPILLLYLIKEIYLVLKAKQYDNFDICSIFIPIITTGLCIGYGFTTGFNGLILSAFGASILLLLSIIVRYEYKSYINLKSYRKSTESLIKP